MAAARPVNWGLLQELQLKPHPQLRDSTEAERRDLHYSILEVLSEAKVTHHLLDMAGVPDGESYGADTGSIDCRTLIAIIGMGNLRERLGRISGWHARETGPAGTVGDFCTECGRRWPCDSRRMADGTYVDEDEPVTESGSRDQATVPQPEVREGPRPSA